MYQFNIIIQNATIYDGSGRPPYQSDIGIKDGRIAAIESKLNAGDRIIDARNLALCPGFIDIHSHADLTIHLDDHPQILSPLLRQGVTTFVGGNCGMGPAPLDDRYRHDAVMYVQAMQGESEQYDFQWTSIADFFLTLEKQGMILNCGYLVPHGMLRIASKGLDNSTASRDEINHMSHYLQSGLDAGALGMSTGLMYFPGLNADSQELAPLARIVSKYDGVFASHIRSYSNTIINAIDEMISLSQLTDVRVQISHLFHMPHVHPLIDAPFRGLLRMLSYVNRYVTLPIPEDNKLKNILLQLNEQIQKGMPIGIDVMPTSTGFTHILAFFPPWALLGSRQELIHRLTDPVERQNIYQAIMTGKSIWPHRDRNTWSMNFFKILGFRSIHLMSVITEKNKPFEGMSLHDIAKIRGQKPFDLVCDLLLEEEGRVLIFIAPTTIGDEFVEQFSACAVCDPNTSIVTDTIMFGFGKPSHLFYDCYPKLISRYVKKRKALDY
ncbi:MAG: amidohydrolase [Candidatus Magnetoglobus multicellularis str. Araruama]|uniref:Amidohydrolase n=1 Tax=Candidatus Magnetoglobus multicellularis str. Araruama TaxID=890399 RepID=A0A1V1P8V0_9BACT|nr:MAG: amidohydrolase [Candidatus Magnetoglobus multicellularis str. Araruama]